MEGIPGQSSQEHEPAQIVKGDVRRELHGHVERANNIVSLVVGLVTLVGVFFVKLTGASPVPFLTSKEFAVIVFLTFAAIILALIIFRRPKRRIFIAAMGFAIAFFFLGLLILVDPGFATAFVSPPVAVSSSTPSPSVGPTYAGSPTPFPTVVGTLQVTPTAGTGGGGSTGGGGNSGGGSSTGNNARPTPTLTPVSDPCSMPYYQAVNGYDPQLLIAGDQAETQKVKNQIVSRFTPCQNYGHQASIVTIWSFVGKSDSSTEATDQANKIETILQELGSSKFIFVGTAYSKKNQTDSNFDHTAYIGLEVTWSK
jgi:hypothetical protein